MAWLLCVHASVHSGTGQELTRTESGLVIFYDFNEVIDGRIPNRPGLGTSADLNLQDPEAVGLQDGSLTLSQPTRLRSRDRPERISDLVRIAGELSVEAWIEPSPEFGSTASLVVAMANGNDQRNFELGQAGDRFQAMFRTSRTGSEGAPQIDTPDGSAAPALAHLVFTRDRSGRSRIFLNGEIVAQQTIPGSTSDWEKTTLTLGNGPRGKRPWIGTFHLVAIYGRDLLEEEVARNYRAGPRTASQEFAPVTEGLTVFESKIAPLLASRCLDCHDSAVRQGGLDLSRRESALAGGDHGNAIVPGEASASLAWLMVVSDAMPQNRPALTPAEKESLRQWIEAGAHWPIETFNAGGTHERESDLHEWVRRLTLAEYITSVLEATGVEVAEEARRLLPSEVRADGFDNTAYNLTVDLGHVEAYAKLARFVADRLDVERMAGDEAAASDELLLAMGRRILRGPLTELEVALYRDLARFVESIGGSRDDAVRQVAQAMLQSPRFLYRIEQQRGDGTWWPADPHELASRLSYIIWGAPPDEALYEAAEAGSLHDLAEIRRHARRMLRDPRAVARSIDFLDQWLDLGQLESLSPDLGRFPNWSRQLASDMRSETVAFFEDLVWKQERPLADLLDAQFSYLTPRLTAHYGLEAQGPGLRRYDLRQIPSRGGILTHGAVLTKGGTEASMVTRGLFVLTDLLSGAVGSPPPGLDTTPIPASPGRSRRAIATDRVESEACGGCHVKFEPLAFGLERFDGLGSYQEIDEHGNDLREDGEIRFPGSSEPIAYATTAQLMNHLSGSDNVQKTITRKMTQFAIGRPLVSSDSPVVEAIHRLGRAAGGTYQSLIEAIVTSDLVRKTRTER